MPRPALLRAPVAWAWLAGLALVVVVVVAAAPAAMRPWALAGADDALAHHADPLLSRGGPGQGLGPPLGCRAARGFVLCRPGGRRWSWLGAPQRPMRAADAFLWSAAVWTPGRGLPAPGDDCAGAAGGGRTPPVGALPPSFSGDAPAWGPRRIPARLSLSGLSAVRDAGGCDGCEAPRAMGVDGGRSCRAGGGGNLPAGTRRASPPLPGEAPVGAPCRASVHAGPLGQAAARGGALVAASAHWHTAAGGFAATAAGGGGRGGEVAPVEFLLAPPTPLCSSPLAPGTESWARHVVGHAIDDPSLGLDGQSRAYAPAGYRLRLSWPRPLRLC